MIVIIYEHTYRTPANFADILMTSDGECLTGLWFKDSKNIKNLATDQDIITNVKENSQIFNETIEWLDIYFSGREPDFKPNYLIKNDLTRFRKEVIDIMSDIPFGHTISYNDIAKVIAKERGLKRMSPQAVGGAVGWNPISIIIPCHRVIGSNGKLVGYGGGIRNKIELLKLENNDI